MERAATPHPYRRFVWLTTVYAAVIAIVLYPALHEELGTELLLWNCIPATLGLLVITTAFAKSRRRMVVSATFALLTATVTAFFLLAWLFAPLDLDPRSGTTKLVFVFAPFFRSASR